MSAPCAVLLNVKYSPNLGDGLASECLEWALQRHLPGWSLKIIDLSGRQCFAERSGRSRALFLSILNRIGNLLGTELVRLGLKWKLRSHWGVVEGRIGEAAVAILGSGHLLQDDRMNFPTKVGRVAAICARAGTPLALFGVGAAPGWSSAARSEFAKISACNLVKLALRDQFSLDLLKRELGPSLTEEMSVVRDPALLAEKVFGSAPPIRKEGAVIGIGIAHPRLLRHHANRVVAGGDDLRRYFVALMLNLVEQGYGVVAFSNGAGEDDRYLENVLSSRELAAVREKIVRAPRPAAPTDLHRIISMTDAVVAHRLHACILAYALGRPVVALSWDQKVEDFMQSVGLERFVASSALVDVGEPLRPLRDASRAGVDESMRLRAILDAERNVMELAGAALSCADHRMIQSGQSERRSYAYSRPHIAAKSLWLKDRRSVDWLSGPKRFPADISVHASTDHCG